MNILNKFHQYLESEIPAENKSGLKGAVLFCSFVYIIVPAYIIYIVPDEETLSTASSGGAQLVTFLNGFWWLFLIGAASCGFIWHFFHNTGTVKTSIAAGVSIFLFAHMLIIFGVIWSLYVYTRTLH